MSRFTTVQAKFLLGVLPVVILVAFIFSAILGFQDYQNAHQVLKAKQRQLPQGYCLLRLELKPRAPLFLLQQDAE